MRPRDAFDAARARRDIRQARDRGKILITFTRYGVYSETEETPLVILVRERDSALGISDRSRQGRGSMKRASPDECRGQRRGIQNAPPLQSARPYDLSHEFRIIRLGESVELLKGSIL